MGVRTAERMTGDSVFMAGLQQSNAHHYSAKPERRPRRWEPDGAENPAPIRKQILIRRGSRRGLLHFIRAGTVKARNGDVEQPEIDGELGAMMDEVVKAHSANAGYARHGENLLAASQKLPAFHYVCVADVGECGARFSAGFVKGGEKLRAILDLRRLVGRAVHGCVIELLRVDGHGDPFGDVADMSGEPAKGPGFFVRLPVPLFIGTA